MPIDSTGIESQIDANLTDNTSRQNGANVIRFILKTVVRWVRDAVNGNLSTWLRTSDNQAGGANADAVYRTGNTEFRGGILARTRTPDNSPLANVAHGGAYPLMVMGFNGGPAFMEFHLPGLRIDQLGVDVDGKLKVHPWGTAAAYALVIDTLTAMFALSATVGNRKLVLYDTNNNDHQFYGLGINGGVLRFQVPDTASNHIFYAGTSAATSAELMRISGGGKVGINTATPSFRLSVDDADPSEGVLAQFGNTVTGGNGAKIRMTLKGFGQWDVGLTAALNAFVIVGWNGNGMSERVRIDQNGALGIGTQSPTTRLHVNGANGYNQFRLEQKYTPTGTGDANGPLGSFAWDDNYLYIKTAAGWKRSALSTF